MNPIMDLDADERIVGTVAVLAALAELPVLFLGAHRLFIIGAAVALAAGVILRAGVSADPPRPTRR